MALVGLPSAVRALLVGETPPSKLPLPWGATGTENPSTRLRPCPRPARARRKDEGTQLRRSAGGFVSRRASAPGPPGTTLPEKAVG